VFTHTLYKTHSCHNASPQGGQCGGRRHGAAIGTMEALLRYNKPQLVGAARWSKLSSP
jgi:hypothetical protein